jgi:hypothetical protein
VGTFRSISDRIIHTKRLSAWCELNSPLQQVFYSKSSQIIHTRRYRAFGPAFCRSPAHEELWQLSGTCAPPCASTQGVLPYISGEEPDLDSLTTSRLASNSSSLLLELSGEIKEANRMEGFPPKKLRRMMKAFDKLKAFCERVLAFYDQRFGAQEDDEANLIGGKRP